MCSETFSFFRKHFTWIPYFFMSQSESSMSTELHTKRALLQNCDQMFFLNSLNCTTYVNSVFMKLISGRSRIDSCNRFSQSVHQLRWRPHHGMQNLEMFLHLPWDQKPSYNQSCFIPLLCTFWTVNRSSFGCIG